MFNIISQICKLKSQYKTTSSAPKQLIKNTNTTVCGVKNQSSYFADGDVKFTKILD